MNENDAKAFFNENPLLSGVIAAVNGVDAQNEGDAGAVTYNVWVNGKNGAFLLSNQFPHQDRPPAGTAITAARVGRPAIVFRIGGAYFFQVIGENYAVTENCA